MKLIRKKSRGYSLVELMIAAALGLLLVSLVVAAVTNAIAISSRIGQAGELFENAQYLTRLLKYELSMAGFYGGVDYPVNTSIEKPHICNKISDGNIANTLSYPIDGINAVASGGRLCGKDLLLPGSDVLLVRRSLLAEYSPRSRLKSKQHYIQTSTDNFVLSLGSKPADFYLTNEDNSEFLPVRIWQQTIYYLSADNNFKRRRFLKGKYTRAEPLVEGVIDFQLLYGIAPSSREGGDPSVEAEFVEFPTSKRQWQQLVAIRFYLLLSSTEQSSGDGNPKLLNYLGKEKQVFDNRQYDLFSGMARLKNISPVIMEFDIEI